MTNASHALRVAFRQQARACLSLDSPFMDRLCRLMADRLSPGTAVTDRLLSWPGDVSNMAASVPLRVTGALHGIVLDNLDPELAAAYPPHAVSEDILWQAVMGAFERHEGRVLAWLDHAPQTNEVRRSGAIMAGAAHLRAHIDLPLTVSELGASAGLNLHFDRYRLELGPHTLGAAISDVVLRPEITGPLPPSQPLEIVGRAGVDLNPLDISQPDERARLLAFLWPDQTERIARTQAAIAHATVVPDAGDAAAWLETRLAEPMYGTCHLIFHTVAWQYFPAETQARCDAALRRAGADATPQAPLAHFAMEADGAQAGAAMTLRIWDGHGAEPKTLALGRVDFHGRYFSFNPHPSR